MSKFDPERSNLLHGLIAREGGRVHLAGVCGVGMAGIALHLKQRGLCVTGCDASPNALAAWLARNGMEVLSGHHPDHARDADWIVRSAAVRADSPEIMAAASAGVPVFARGEVLPVLLRDRLSVAVGGTHGKTTTTTFITLILRSAGRDPGWCIGGESGLLAGVAGAGRGDTLVVEADESDGTIALYAPDVAVVTNIEFDHMEHFANVEEFEGCFRSFVRQTARRVIYCADDPRAASVCGAAAGARSFGLSGRAAVRATNIAAEGERQEYDLECDGQVLGRVELPVAGRHNILNSLAAAAACMELGLSFEEVREGLRQVRLPRRRLERIAERDGLVVLSDYAHHPTEIAALLNAAAKLPARRRVAVYQPHRYSRTLALGPDFPPAFAGLDELVLAPVYAASEPPLQGGSVWDLYAHLRASHSAAPHCVVATSLENAWAYLRRRLRAGDLFMVVGAGDVEKIAFWARDALQGGMEGLAGPWSLAALRGSPEGRLLSGATELRADEPLAPKTTLKVGGAADLWAGVGTVADLQLLIRWAHRTGTPFKLLGAGSNTLVSDLGVRGLTARMSGDAFRTMREEKGLIVAGACVTIPAFLQRLQSAGLEGLEFLEGIPGTLGGALHMNAGAWGGEITSRVEWIRCLNGNGDEHIVPRSKLVASYRECPSLRGMIVIEAAFTLDAGSREKIAASRAELAEKRRWMDGLNSAGSVFKNPSGMHVGKLLEAAGMKGQVVGGASVSLRHANFIVTGAGARAADVQALMERMRASVEAHAGVRIEPEIKLLE
jgi:UDP-N-acetylmuramate--alanine ligase